MPATELVFTALGAVSALAWLGLLLYPARPWDLRPVAEDWPWPAHEPARWPEVAVVVPARNEAGTLPRTLPALLAQDYPGRWSVVLVDDRSGDGTAGVARRIGDGRLTVVEGEPLPEGWVGKVWTLEQGVRAATGSDGYVLLTDADIAHSPSSLRSLVAESEAQSLAVNSRMARLRCRSAVECLLIPPFLFFFNCLYSMRRANDPADRLAAAAGGCVLVRRDVLGRAGLFASIRGAVIDDVSLARGIKGSGGKIRLAVSREDVVSVREHDTLGSVSRMVARTAFTQLRRSWLLLAATLAGLALLFPLPPALLALGAALEWWPAAVLGGAVWALMTATFLPTISHFGLRFPWALTLPLAGCLYGAMTLDSALRPR